MLQRNIQRRGKLGITLTFPFLFFLLFIHPSRRNSLCPCHNNTANLKCQYLYIPKYTHERTVFKIPYYISPPQNCYISTFILHPTPIPETKSAAHNCPTIKRAEEPKLESRKRWTAEIQELHGGNCEEEAYSSLFTKCQF
jgi:hypothetical protein